MRTLKQLTASLLLIAAAACASAGGSSQPDLSTRSQYRAIAVTATSAQDEALAGASVSLVGKDGSGVECYKAPCVTNVDGYVLFPWVRMFEPVTVRVQADGFVAQEVVVQLEPGSKDVAIRLARIAVPLPEPSSLCWLKANGPVFTCDGADWRWKGVSAFDLAHRFENGDDIDGFLSSFAGYNLLRVWDYTPVDHKLGDGRDWEGTEWPSSSPEAWLRFLKYVGDRGWHVELTLLTDSDPARVPTAIQLVEALVAARPPNVVFEAGNEPLTNGKTIGVIRALRPALEAAGRAGYLYTSGVYEDTREFYGSYGVFHSARDGEWVRKSHDAIDYFHGGGPSYPSEPAWRIPWVCDEPGKWQDVGTDPADWRAYFGGCSIMAAGATFHSESGKLTGKVIAAKDRALDLDLSKVALSALNAFPENAPRGPYGRPVENSLRTYTVGQWMVRVRPATDVPPYPADPLDSTKVLWKIR